MGDMAARIGVSRPTLRNMENGNPNVSMGIYAAALMVFDKLPKFEHLFDDERAATAYLEAQKIPKRIRSEMTRLQKKKRNKDQGEKIWKPF
jgi:DNA-binding XRE family transcriptional regulator